MAITISKPATKHHTGPKPTGAKPTKPPKSANATAEYLTTKQVGEMLQITPKVALKIIKEKGIPYFTIGGRNQVRIHRSHLELLMDKKW